MKKTSTKITIIWFVIFAVPAAILTYLSTPETATAWIGLFASFFMLCAAPVLSLVFLFEQLFTKEIRG